MDRYLPNFSVACKSDGQTQSRELTMQSTPRCKLPNCDMALPIVTNQAVRIHLQRQHPDLIYKAKTAVVVCTWPGCHHSRMLKRNSLVKHIANSHLGAGKRTCPTCNLELSTLDALRRHQQSLRCRAGDNYLHPVNETSHDSVTL